MDDPREWTKRQQEEVQAVCEAAYRSALKGAATADRPARIDDCLAAAQAAAMAYLRALPMPAASVRRELA